MNGLIFICLVIYGVRGVLSSSWLCTHKPGAETQGGERITERLWIWSRKDVLKEERRVVETSCSLKPILPHAPPALVWHHAFWEFLKMHLTLLSVPEYISPLFLDLVLVFVGFSEIRLKSQEKSPVIHDNKSYNGVSMVFDILL